MSLKRASKFSFQNPRSKKGLLSGVITTAILVLFSSQVTLAQAGVMQAIIRPVNPQTDEGIFYYEIKPGDTLTDQYWFLNSSEEENSLKTYISFSFETENGKFLSLKDDEKKGLAAWTSLEEYDVTLDPLEKRKMDLTISIPADTQQGLYEGAIVMQKEGDPIPGSPIKNEFRLAIPLKVNVTDSPAEFIKANVFSLKITNYFWIAAVIFLGSISFYLRASRKEKKVSKK